MTKKEFIIDKGNHQRGLTLVEIILAASIISILSLVLYHTVVNGLKVWERAHRFVIEEDLVIFFDQISQELRNSFSFSQISFEGRTASLSFPTVIQTKADQKLTQGQVIYVKQMGQVYYYYDALKGILYREEANYSLALQKRFFMRRPILSSLHHVEFIYYVARDGKITKLEQTNVLPVMVQIIMQYRNQQGQRRVMQKSILIPSAGVENG